MKQNKKVLSLVFSVLLGVAAALTGNASTATTATNSTNAAITNDTTTSSYVYPTWVGTSSGNQAVKTTDTKLKYKL